MAYCDKLAAQLKEKGVRVKVDSRDMRTPDKMWDAVKKGIPLRVEVGVREMEEGQVTHVRRDLGRDSKTTVSFDDFINGAQGILDAIHDDLLTRQRQFSQDNTHQVDTVADIEAFFKAGKKGYVCAPIAVLEDEALDAVKTEYGLTARNIPFAYEGQRVLIAKAY